MEEKQLKLTHDILTAVSQRLAGRSEYSKTEYHITITSKDIQITPLIYVFPDYKHRKPSDKQLIIEYILNEHFPELLSYFSAKHKPECITPIEGEYMYKLYPLAHRRKWVKIS